MKAWTYQRYGTSEVLQLTEAERPKAAGNEVLIRVHAASLNAADWHLMSADVALVRLSSGLRRPKNPMLGADVAGIVESVGPDVVRFKPGDRVYGDLSHHGNGAFAEFACAREDKLAMMPAGASFVEAAASSMAALTALQGLRDAGEIAAGQDVLINGASGGVGTFAVQIAKAYGAKVTAVCSTAKVDVALRLGADRVVDYTKEDFTVGGYRYDLVLGVGGGVPTSRVLRALKSGGIYALVGSSGRGMLRRLLLSPLQAIFSSRKVRVVMAKENGDDLRVLNGWYESGEVRPVIDRTCGFAEVPEAMAYLGEGHAAGKVVISVGE
ncbi:MAG TPA: NAD(P)-dependent alcohol dehydrogenase [Spirochaetia bacterium]|nr:NAD(P)-dependent alcohol dehydrogenase [Spirochaetia bacterium]